MVQGYYTLQEAAQFLSISVDELKQMAQKGQIRSFQDRGTLRFRIQDIQELARQRSSSSDPELALGDGSLPPPKSAAAPSSGGRKAHHSPRTPSKKQDVPDVFDFEFDNENVDLSADFLAPPSNPKNKPGSKGNKKQAASSGATQGSDSDVRLVSDGSDVSFSVAKDSDIKLADSAVVKGPSGPVKPKTSMNASPSGKRSSQVNLGSGVQQPSKTGLSGKQPQASPRPGSGPQPVDSGVRLVPMDSDSDVKILGASDEVPLGEQLPPSHTDSNVRLDRVPLPPADSGEGNMMQTEEINLDEELRKLEQGDQDKPATKMKAKSELKFPTTSPFELSDSEVKMPSELLESSGPKTPLKKREDDSSDFEIGGLPAQAEDGSSDFDLLPANDENADADDSDFSLELPHEEQDQALEQQPAEELTSSTSGISLSNPADAGISLEEGGDAEAGDGMDFDLSLEVDATPRPVLESPAADSDSDFQLQAGDTPRPQESVPAQDESSSEFELSLESSDPETQALQENEGEVDFSLEVDQEQQEQTADSQGGEDSEFELNVSGDEEMEESKQDGDSEFELTLDDSGNIASLEADEDTAPQVKSKKKPAPATDDEQDIFETDFEVPALDESDENTVADSELESSDFDLALDDSELAAEEESGSQVVALDEEDAEALVDSDADAAVVDDLEVEEESSDFGDLDEDVAAETDKEEAETDEEGAEEVERETVVKEKLLPAAPWGVMPVVFMLPCVVVMFLVGILGYELMQSTAGLRAPGPLTIAIADMLGQQITVKK